MMNIRKRITALGLRFASKRKPFRSRGNGHQRCLLFERMEERRLFERIKNAFLGCASHSKEGRFKHSQG